MVLVNGCNVCLRGGSYEGERQGKVHGDKSGCFRLTIVIVGAMGDGTDFVASFFWMDLKIQADSIDFGGFAMLLGLEVLSLRRN